MYTQCPQCLTVFAIDAQSIALAHGCVGCGECGATFDVTATLCDELPTEPFETLPLNDPATAPPLVLSPVAHARPAQPGLFDAAEDGYAKYLHNGAADDHGSPAHAAAMPGDAMPFQRRPRRRAALLHSRWALGCMALGLCLVVQLAWAERAALVSSPQTGPWLRRVCAALHVPPPLASDVARLSLVSREVRRHPTVADALMISATLRNDAPFSQRYPIIDITLSNLDDQRIAMRRFRPAQYIDDQAVRAAGIAPGAQTAVVFEVVDPGHAAVAFEFAFEASP